MRELETERLLLRPFTLDDLDELSVIFGDADVVRYLGSGKAVEREETLRALLSIIQHWERHGFGRWAVVFKPTQELIGYGGLRSFHGTPELVYLLSKAYWGIGLATEMATISLKYGFEEQQFERIIAMANVANTASQHVLEKIGMTFEKTAHIYNMDIFCYAISRATYLSRQIENSHRHQQYFSSLDTSADEPLLQHHTLLAVSTPEREVKTASR